jgi:hypothetical protein
MSDEILIVDGVDVSHFRLIDLTRLADQSRSFYDWVEAEFRQALGMRDSLDQILRTAEIQQIQYGITLCYHAQESTGLPVLFDGIGRTYSHQKACFYFFSWLIRDAPQQRLSPLIQRITRKSSRTRIESEIAVLSALIVKYRQNVKTFAWEAIREIIIDRLEGSRRSLKGHEKESIVRIAVLEAVQGHFAKFANYGIYAAVEIPKGQVKVGNETFDVSVNLLNDHGNRVRRILIPIKTRETEGGGHSHLFSRDIASAISTVREDNTDDFLAVIIVAGNWSRREAEALQAIVDHLAVFNIDPGNFTAFTDDEQKRLNSFIEAVLNGTVGPKS